MGDRRHGPRVGRHGVLARHPGPAPGVGEDPGGPRRPGRLRLVLPRGERAGGWHHVHHQPVDGAARHRPGRPLLPRSLSPRPALHDRRVGRPHGGGRRAGDRPPFRALRRGVGQLLPVGPHRNVDLGQRWGPPLRDGRGPGPGGVVDGRGGRLPRPAGARRLVPRLVHGPGRCRRLGGCPRRPGRRLRCRRAAVPRRHAGRADSRRRLSRLRRQPQHGPAGRPEQRARDAGQGAAPLVLGGGDLRHVAGPELDGVTARAAAPLAPELTVRPAHLHRERALRAERSADLLHREPDGQPRVPRRERAGAVVPRRQDLRRRRRHRRLAHRSGCRVHLHGRLAGEHRHPGGPASGRQPVRAPPGHRAPGGAAAARLPARAGPGPRRHRPRHLDLRQGAVAHPLDRCTHALLGGHPAAAGGRGHRRRIPLREPDRLLRADLHLAGRDAALARHSRPRGGRLRARRLQPHHRPLSGACQRRARLGPGVVPRLRLAGLRPDGGRAAQRPQPRLDGPARRRRPPCAACPWSRWRWCW